MIKIRITLLAKTTFRITLLAKTSFLTLSFRKKPWFKLESILDLIFRKSSILPGKTSDYAYTKLIYTLILLKDILNDINFQKQPPRGVLSKRCSETMQQICRRASMPKCDFNKVAMRLYWNQTLAGVLSSKFVAFFPNTFF